MMSAFAICVLAFVALPFVAGIGLTVWFFGPESIKDGALPWILYICVGTFIGVMLADSILEPLFDRYLPGPPIAGEALQFVIGIWVITMGYRFFFTEYLPALSAAVLSALGLLVFIPLIKSSEKRFKRAEAESE
ncbi:hypothetical protein [Paeniglutamicibacter sp. Y32M11]|uniref:hypothetical protein n=1 Tax=Paeniglutamicibacter sp. Y32M11 TaxID=2853258 RepID=UPI001C528474|nr:hypothetical protein [Paeniglutamicibacter sp. Y32M11]QXQ10205.1 hypothetical protein KUF55_17530 [Paeniglutamicibacter sp. Y32M11]